MDTKNLIPVQLVCKRYHIPVTFLNTLQDYELIEIIVEQNDFYVHTRQLKKVEKMMRLYFDLNINFEGLDAIYHLLNQVESLNKEIITLHNRLRIYEDF